MRIIIACLFVLSLIQPVLAQPPSKTQKPVKNEMQAAMMEAVNELKKQITELEKQLAEAIKNKEDEETIKGIKEQITMFKKQVAMMQGVNKSISEVPEKTFEQAAVNDAIVPRKDIARIKSLPDKIVSEVELTSFIKKIFIEVEKNLPATEKIEALKIYNETKDKYNSVIEINNAATGCWIYGHWEKALWLSGKACLDNLADADNLNNYAAFLTMISGEQAAIPILQYLNNKYPKNSTVLNNIGQAWFGLGDLPTAKKFLENATTLFPDHSMANLTLSTIYRSEADSPRAIAAIRRSIKNCYTPEKEAELESLGEDIDDDDIDFDYPMEDDPFGFDPFFDEFPSVPGSMAETPRAYMEWEAFEEATQSLYEKVLAEEDAAKIRTEAFINKMSDPDYHQPVLKLHNSNVHIKAGRKLVVGIRKKTALSIDEVMNMMANVFHQVTTERLNALVKKRQEELKVARGCAAVAAVNNNFMSEAKTIIDEGSAAMRTVYRENKKKVHNFIKLSAYSATNDYNESMGKFHEEIWKKNQWIYTYTARFASVFKSLKQRPTMYSGCEENEEVPKQTKHLPSIKKPDCTHRVSLNLPVGGIKEECNTCVIDESKLKYRQDISQKGEIQISDAANSTAQGPQRQETVDPSKTTTIECNKSGSVKIDRGRATKAQRCTVNSERRNGFHSSHILGGRLGLAR